MPKEKLQIKEENVAEDKEDKSVAATDEDNIEPPEKKKRLSNKEWKQLKKQKGQNKVFNLRVFLF